MSPRQWYVSLAWRQRGAIGAFQWYTIPRLSAPSKEDALEDARAELESLQPGYESGGAYINERTD